MWLVQAHQSQMMTFDMATGQYDCIPSDCQLQTAKRILTEDIHLHARAAAIDVEGYRLIVRLMLK